MAFVLLLAGCGGSAPAVVTPQADDPAARVKAFDDVEDEVLRDLAAIDRRLAARTRITPGDDDLRRVALAALDDPSLATVDGVIDPFSFDARARGLAAAKKKLESAPANLPQAPTMEQADAALERDLLARLVDEELVRLDEERRLPRSASSLVRAVVETWTPPTKPDQAAARDRWLARRLVEVRTAVDADGLDIARARELDDALDALEHDIDAPGFSASTGELVKLRDSLEGRKGKTPTASAADWTALATSLGAHLGVHGGPEAIEKALAVAEARLTPRAETAVQSSRMGADVLATNVAQLVFSSAPCSDAVVGSKLRSMMPGPERSAACQLRHAVRGNAQSDAVALAAMHEHVVVARWALAIAAGSTLGEASAKHHLLTRPPPDALAHWERMAVARPVVAIGAGLAAAILGNEDVGQAAKSWDDLGEVPLDVAVHRVAGHPEPAIY
jgi:hypothetical protein